MSEFKVSDEVLHNINGCFEGYPVMMEEEVRAIVAAVARAAQVQVLRELLATSPYDVDTSGVEAWVNHRIWELNAGL